MRPQDFGLREDRQGWFCTCGSRLWPDCDVSAASVGDEFFGHLREDHGFTTEAIALALIETP